MTGVRIHSSSGPRERIVDAVLGVSRKPRRRRWLFPVAVAVAAHLGLALLAPANNSNEQWALTTAQRVRSLLAAQAARPIDLPPPPKVPEQAKSESQPAHPKAPPAAARAPARLRAQAPARAGNVIARAPTAEPVDFSSSFVVGTGNVYSGGSTTSSGTSSKAVPGAVSTEPDPPAHPAPTASTPDLSRPIALADPDWTCPWPREADDAQIDEQAAIVRVVVSPEGRCESAAVVLDPGYGFGPQATKCARDAQFLPAHDRNGQPIRGNSSIRVRFTR